MLDDLAATLLVQVMSFFLHLHAFKMTVNCANVASQSWQLQVLYDFANDAL